MSDEFSPAERTKNVYQWLEKNTTSAGGPGWDPHEIRIDMDLVEGYDESLSIGPDNFPYIREAVINYAVVENGMVDDE